MCLLENMRAAQGPRDGAACVEETLKNVNLEIACTSTATAKNVAIVFLKTGSSSLILSTCRLNILRGSIVLLMSLFWLQRRGKGEEGAAAPVPKVWSLRLFINTMKNDALVRSANTNSQCENRVHSVPSAFENCRLNKQRKTLNWRTDEDGRAAEQQHPL